MIHSILFIDQMSFKYKIYHNVQWFIPYSFLDSGGAFENVMIMPIKNELDSSSTSIN